MKALPVLSRKRRQELLAKKLDCTACGACCVASFDEETYADLYPKDVKALRDKVGSKRLRSMTLTHRDDFGKALGEQEAKSLRTKINGNGHTTCIALRGSVGRAVECGIYDVRPTVCRSFKVGSDACLADRKRLGLPIPELS